MAINTSNNKVRIISTTISGLSTNSKFSDIKSPALVVNTSDGGIFYADGSGGTSLKQLAALPSHTHSGYATTTQLGDYLLLSGGTLKGDSADLLIINRLSSTSTAYITFKGNNSLRGRIGFNSDGFPVVQVPSIGTDNQLLIHSGNFDTYCASVGHSHNNYLPLSGGTISGNFSVKPTNTGYFQEGIRIYKSPSVWAGIAFGFNEGEETLPKDGWWAAVNPSKEFVISAGGSDSCLGLRLIKDGDAKWRNNTIIHSGNIGSQSVASATNATKSESLTGGHGVSNAANYSITYLAGGFTNNTTPTANQVYLGTSSNWDVISSPVHDGTDAVQNIMSLRLAWNKSYWHEIATGPNANNRLYHRSINANTPRSWALLLDSLNYTDYCASVGHTHSDYLPLSGGTMTGSTQVNSSAFPAFILNHTGSQPESGIRFEMNGANKGYVGYHNSYGTYIWNSTAAKYLCIADDGEAYVRSTSVANKVIHSGNIGQQTVASANALNGYTHTNFPKVFSINSSYTNANDIPIPYDNQNSFQEWHLPGVSYNGIIQWRDFGGNYGQLMHIYGNDNLYYRGSAGSKKFREIAFVDTCLSLNGGQMTNGARIYPATNSLYIGRSDNAGWVYMADTCSQSGTDYWNILSTGVARFASTVTAANFITTSDKRLKTNINEISSDKLSNSLNINFVEFDYVNNDNHSAGHIAQEVREVLPEFVHGEETETTHLSVDYTGLHSVQIAALKSENDKLKSIILNLTKRIEALEKNSK